MGGNHSRAVCHCLPHVCGAMALSGDSGAGWGGVVLEVVFHHLVGTGAAHTGRAVLGDKGPKKAGV